MCSFFLVFIVSSAVRVCWLLYQSPTGVVVIAPSSLRLWTSKFTYQRHVCGSNSKCWNEVFMCDQFDRPAPCNSAFVPCQGYLCLCTALCCFLSIRVSLLLQISCLWTLSETCLSISVTVLFQISRLFLCSPSQTCLSITATVLLQLQISRLFFCILFVMDMSVFPCNNVASDFPLFIQIVLNININLVTISSNAFHM